MAIKPQLARPGAPQVIPDVDTETSQALGLQFDDVSVLKRIQTAVVCARGHNISGHQGLDGTDPGYAILNAGNHLACIEVLLDRAIDPQADPQTLRIRNFRHG